MKVEPPSAFSIVTFWVSQPFNEFRGMDGADGLHFVCTCPSISERVLTPARHGGNGDISCFSIKPALTCRPSPFRCAQIPLDLYPRRLSESSRFEGRLFLITMLGITHVSIPLEQRHYEHLSNMRCRVVRQRN